MTTRILFRLLLITALTAGFFVVVPTEAFQAAVPDGTPSSSSSSKNMVPHHYIPCIPLKDLPSPGHATSTRITTTTTTTGGDATFISTDDSSSSSSSSSSSTAAAASTTTKTISICIAVDHKGYVYALANHCPPMNAPLSDGKLHAEDGTIQDPLLGTKFSLVTGQVVGPWCPTLTAAVPRSIRDAAATTTAAAAAGGGFLGKFLSGLFLRLPESTTTVHHDSTSSAPSTGTSTAAATSTSTQGVKTFPIRQRNGNIEIEIEIETYS